MRGIVDTTGKVIVPCEFSYIESLAHGLFFLEYFPKDNPLNRSYVGRLVDHDGNTINVNVPAGSELSKVFLPPEQIPDDTLWHSLPIGTFLRFKNTDGFGLCRLNGDIILAAGKHQIGTPNGGYFPVFSKIGIDGSPLLFTVDSATGKKIAAPVGAYIVDKPRTNEIFPFYTLKNQRRSFGYMSRTGAIIVAPRYSYAREFSEGLAAVEGKKFGSGAYIDKHGKTQSPKGYAATWDFSDGYAVVGVVVDGMARYCLIDKKFRVVIPPKYSLLTHLFDKTYFAVEDRGGRCKAIDVAGKTVFEFPEDIHSTASMHGDLIACYRRTPGPYPMVPIYLDHAGKVVASSPSTRSPQQPPQPKTLSADRVLKTVRNDHFNNAIWNDQQLKGAQFCARLEQFSNLLADYNLIGMSKGALEKLIGKPDKSDGDVSQYILTTGFGGLLGRTLEFDCTSGKLLRWRELHQQDEGYAENWVTTNVIYDWESDSPARIGAFPTMVLKPKPGSN